MKGKPAGHRILIRPMRVEDTDKDFKRAKEIGLDLSHSNEYKREQHASTRGTVLQLGHSCWRAYDSNWDGWKPWCEVGDDVLFGRFSGKSAIDPETGEELLLINDDDVIYVFDKEEQE